MKKILVTDGMERSAIDELRRLGYEVTEQFYPPEELGEGCYEDPPPPDAALARRVDELPLEMGTVIKLRFYEDMPLKEISAVTGWNLNTVKTRLYTGLQKLRVSLEGVQEK